MKGFTKGKGKGKKFIPTNNKKIGLKKSDIIQHQFADDRIGRTLPLVRRKETLDNTHKECPKCGKSIDMGNDEMFYHKGKWYGKNSVAYPYKMESHFEEEHTPEEFGVERANTHDGWLGNTSFEAFRKHFGDNSQEESIAKAKGMTSDEMDRHMTEHPEEYSFKQSLDEHTKHDPFQDYQDMTKEHQEKILKSVFSELGITQKIDMSKMGSLGFFNPRVQEAIVNKIEYVEDDRDKQTLGHFGNTVIDREDDGTLSDHPKDHPKEIHRFKDNLDGAEGRLAEPALVIASVNGTRLGHTSPSNLSDDELEDEMDKYVEFRTKIMKNPRSEENDAVFRRTQNFLKELANESTERDLQRRGVGGRSKFSLLGTKSPQELKLEAKEDKIDQNNKLVKQTEKIEKKQAKADEKTSKQLRKTDEQKLKSNEKSIRFLENQIKGLQEKPAKFGVNAQSQLDVIEQARGDLTELQSESDEIRTRLNEVE